jgi:hypothetical protein
LTGREAIDADAVNLAPPRLVAGVLLESGADVDSDADVQEHI